MRTLALIFLAFFLTVSAYAEENITITTYYPSPSGSYRDLSVSSTLTLESVPLNNDAPQILWNTSTSNISWNIDQLDDKLRFYSEDNPNVAGRIGVSLTPETGTTGSGRDGYMELLGRDRPFNLILRREGNFEQLGKISFQSSSDTENARIWATRINNPFDVLGKLFMSTDGDNPHLVINEIGNVGIGTTSPSAKLDVSGGISASAGIKIGSVSSTCNSSRAGTMRYNSGVMEFCDGSSWSTIGGSLDYRIVGRSTTYKKCCGGTITATCPSSYNRAIGGACRCGGDSPGGGRINSNNFVCSCERASGSGCTTGYAQVVCVK